MARPLGIGCTCPITELLQLLVYNLSRVMKHTIGMEIPSLSLRVGILVLKPAIMTLELLKRRIRIFLFTRQGMGFDGCRTAIEIRLEWFIASCEIYLGQLDLIIRFMKL